MHKVAAVIIAFILWPATGLPLAAQAAPLKVYYAGPEGSVRTALELAGSLEMVADPAQAQVLVLNGTCPDAESTAALVRQGTGLVLLLGTGITPGQIEALLGTPVTLALQDQAVSLAPVTGSQNPLLRDIVWTSAPQVRKRLVLQGGKLDPLVVGFEDSTILLGQQQLGQGQIYLFTPVLDGSNPQFREWAYFNYLLYNLATRAAGETPVRFGDYAASPVPHARERAALFAGLAGLLFLAGLSFYLVRRYSHAHPEVLGELVISREQFESREADTAWEEVGFHRPLGGFQFALILGMVFFVPLIIYQNLILPVYILPSAQALGIWGRVTQVFVLAWQFFDMGTAVAFIKFFSEYRVHDPRRAIQYAQVFVWWQALSGAFQVALVTAVSGTVLPRTAYALYAWAVISHALIQIPGFFQVMRHALYALQRTDYAQMLDMALSLLFPMIAQPILVTIMVAWGQSHPVFGMAMGGLLGLGLAAYASEALTFLLGLWLYRRLGYSARVLFLAHFDWAVVKEAFRFGVFEMGGAISYGIGQALEIVITQTRLVNYAEVWGNWVLAQNFVFAFSVIYTLYDGLMPSISEAISHARQALSQYYSAVAYKYGAMFSAYIGAVLLAVGDRFILGASGPEFERAALYTIPLVVWGAVQFPSWVGDIVQLGSNRPYLKFAMMAGEQSTRILLAFLLVARFQINGLILAYFIALLSKGILAYLVNNRLCYRQRFFRWQSLVAPLLAGAAHYGLLRGLTGLIWRGDQITSVLILFIGILPSYPLFIFFYGLFGGWDDDTLAEFRQAAGLAGFVRPLARLSYSATALGARLSPLHNRFPIAIRPQAMAEAAALTTERVELV